MRDTVECQSKVLQLTQHTFNTRDSSQLIVAQLKHLHITIHVRTTIDTREGIGNGAISASQSLASIPGRLKYGLVCIACIINNRCGPNAHVLSTLMVKRS